MLLYCCPYVALLDVTASFHPLFTWPFTLILLLPLSFVSPSLSLNAVRLLATIATLPSMSPPPALLRRWICLAAAKLMEHCEPAKAVREEKKALGFSVCVHVFHCLRLLEIPVWS